MVEGDEVLIEGSYKRLESRRLILVIIYKVNCKDLMIDGKWEVGEGKGRVNEWGDCVWCFYYGSREESIG